MLHAIPVTAWMMTKNSGRSYGMNKTFYHQDRYDPTDRNYLSRQAGYNYEKYSINTCVDADPDLEFYFSEDHRKYLSLDELCERFESSADPEKR